MIQEGKGGTKGAEGGRVASESLDVSAPGKTSCFFALVNALSFFALLRRTRWPRARPAAPLSLSRKPVCPHPTQIAHAHPLHSNVDRRAGGRRPAAAPVAGPPSLRVAPPPSPARPLLLPLPARRGAGRTGAAAGRGGGTRRGRRGGSPCRAGGRGERGAHAGQGARVPQCSGGRGERKERGGVWRVVNSFFRPPHSLRRFFFFFHPLLSLSTSTPPSTRASPT